MDYVKSSWTRLLRLKGFTFTSQVSLFQQITYVDMTDSDVGVFLDKVRVAAESPPWNMNFTEQVESKLYTMSYAAEKVLTFTSEAANNKHFVRFNRFQPYKAIGNQIRSPLHAVVAY